MRHVPYFSMSRFTPTLILLSYLTSMTTALETTATIPLIEKEVTSTSMIGIFNAHGDIGAPDLNGSVIWDSERQTYTINGSGRNVWANTDQFHFIHRAISGDFIIQARGIFPHLGTDKHRKFGVMMRDGTNADAAHVNAVVHGDGLTSLQFRRIPGAKTEELVSPLKGANFIQLERRGQRIIMSAAHHGQTFVVCETTDVIMPERMEVGLFVCSHNPAVMETAILSDVRLIIPAKTNAPGNSVPLGSALEILTLDDTARRVVFRSSKTIEAPNWTPDGKALVYNGSGRLHRFDLAAGTTTEIDSGLADKLNNDHLISADGKFAAISHHSAEHGMQSVISILPLTGGTPRLVTTAGPSYLHGWSPDGETLLFVGKRSTDADFNIYSIPAIGGQEKRLTEAVGLDDGPEFSPDGKAIWFNSSRSGSMQIWRMNTDGSEPTQITNDNRQNWFPHVSPDGRWIAYLSFNAEVPADLHPRNKQVTIHVMPITGGPAKIIAYVYGGQGTINVPSWSPDSKQLAFVSYGEGHLH